MGDRSKFLLNLHHIIKDLGNLFLKKLLTLDVSAILGARIPLLNHHHFGMPRKIPDEQRSKPCWHSIESWLLNRDPYNGWLQSPYNWVVFHPLYTTINQGQLVTAPRHCSCSTSRFKNLTPASQQVGREGTEKNPTGNPETDTTVDTRLIYSRKKNVHEWPADFRKHLKFCGKFIESNSSKRINFQVIWYSTLLGTNISQHTFESMIFLFQRWDMDSFPGG